MKQYLELLEKVRNKGVFKGDRTGIGVICYDEGCHATYNLKDHTLPVVTTKKIFLKGIIHELLWFISGSTNIKYLTDNEVSIWDSWANEDGDLGPIYGKQWRDFDGIDQLQEAIRILKEDPESRRNIISSWNPRLLPDPDIAPKDNVQYGKQALPPCHTLYQFTTTPMDVGERKWWMLENCPEETSINVFTGVQSGNVSYEEALDGAGIPKYWLTCHLYQRSGDMFLGVPFNITSYALLTHLVGHCTNTVPKTFSHYIADAHIYTNHLEQVEEQLSRKPMLNFPLKLNPYIRDITKFTYTDIELAGYSHHPAIKAPRAV